jgi:hypothetical protein
LLLPEEEFRWPEANFFLVFFFSCPSSQRSSAALLGVRRTVAPLAAAEWTTRWSCPAGASVGCRLWCGAHVVLSRFVNFLAKKFEKLTNFCVQRPPFSPIFRECGANFLKKIERVSVREWIVRWCQRDFCFDSDLPRRQVKRNLHANGRQIQIFIQMRASCCAELFECHAVRLLLTSWRSGSVKI